MPEVGGSSTQAGIFYQNTVAALALAEMLDLERKSPREQLVEVRLEAPEDVDDVVLRFADSHLEFCNVKLRLQISDRAWPGIWKSLATQFRRNSFREADQLTIIVADRGKDSQAVSDLCERACASLHSAELSSRLSARSKTAFDSISKLLGSDEEAFELIRKCRLLHRSVEECEAQLSRKRLAGARSPAPALISILRDVAGGESRRRGLFQPAPLRRRLHSQFKILIDEPLEWGLAAYREAIARLSNIEVPGLGISGPCKELFVWPRAKEYDPTRHVDFEDEFPVMEEGSEADPSLDLRSFPTDQLDKTIVVAGPGYGKSALLTAIANELCESAFVPVSIPLATFAKADTSIVAFLEQFINQEFNLRADWQTLAEHGLLVLLLDGLDEVPSGLRTVLLNRIALFSARYPRAAWMLSARDASIVSGLHEARVIELLPLNDADIERFGDSMSRFLGGMEGWELANKLELYPDLQRLARIPLFLVMLLGTGGISAGGPTTRSDLIEAYLKTLFEPSSHKNLVEVDDSSSLLRPLAERLAFRLIERQEIGANEREVRRVISELIETREQDGKFLDLLKRNGILRSGELSRNVFPYPIVQEYLAACHLVSEHSNAIASRIDDAIKRPWAQVIQFALEQHPQPEPSIQLMLSREDDAFCTGLRLVGRCVANGAKISPKLKREISDRLVKFWVHAPSNSREKVGQLLADGFTDPLSTNLQEALHCPWLMNCGAGEILSTVNDSALTISVLENLMEKHQTSLMLYRSFRPALRLAGDVAFNIVVSRLQDPLLETTDKERIVSILGNFEIGGVSRDEALKSARQTNLSTQARLRSYYLAGQPLENDAIDLMNFALRQSNWDRNYNAVDLIGLHADPGNLLIDTFVDPDVALERKQKIADSLSDVFSKPEQRNSFMRRCVADERVDESLKMILRLFLARYGDRLIFESLVDEVPELNIGDVSTIISLFGHFPDYNLGARAAELVAKKVRTGEDATLMAGSAATGMTYIFEMDWLNSGVLSATTPHPAIALWVEIVESWSNISDLSVLQRLRILTAASRMGSRWARTQMELILNSVESLDEYPVWEDDYGHTVSSALHELRQRCPTLTEALRRKVLASDIYNISSIGISALQSNGSLGALSELVALHSSTKDWWMRDAAANAIEQLSARVNVSVALVDGEYNIQ